MNNHKTVSRLYTQMTNYCYRKFYSNLMRVVCSVTQSRDGAVFKAYANVKQNKLFALMWCSYAESIPGTLYCLVLLSLHGIVFGLRRWWLWLPTFEIWPSALGVTQQQWEKRRCSSGSRYSTTLSAGESSPGRPHRLKDANIHQNMKPRIAV